MTPAQSRAILRRTMARCDAITSWAKKFRHEGMARARHDGVSLEQGIWSAAERRIAYAAHEAEVMQMAAEAACNMARGRREEEAENE